LQRINLYALCFWDNLQEKGETIPPTKILMDMRRMTFQLKVELEQVNQIPEIVEKQFDNPLHLGGQIGVVAKQMWVNSKDFSKRVRFEKLWF
jgi:hypothetical protein